VIAALDKNRRKGEWKETSDPRKERPRKGNCSEATPFDPVRKKPGEEKAQRNAGDKKK